MRAHTSQRCTGTSLSTSKPSRTLPPLISSTVTLSMRSKAVEPPMTTASLLFLDSTSMENLRFSRGIGASSAAPSVRGHVVGKQEDLHDGAGGEALHDGAGDRLDLGAGFLHFGAGDSQDLLAQDLDGIGEELAVKLLHLGVGGGALGR